MARRDTPCKRWKYRVLSRFPGQIGLDYARKLRRLDAPRAEAAFRAALAAASGGVCIDLGANMGKFTRLMAERAETVYAFEPDPWTAAELRKAVADLDNVQVVEAAAGTRDGQIALYRKPGFEADPAGCSEGASIIAEKRNIDPRTKVDVRIVDFVAFLRALDRDVSVLKIDIEGAEVELLERLLDDPVARRIGHVFAETHENRIPELARRTQALRERARSMTRPVVNLDWE